MSASDCSDKCKSFVFANTAGSCPTHWYQTMEHQTKGGTCCNLHKGSKVCNPCPYTPDLGLVGSPCHPFSTQRANRFVEGSVAAHSECKVAMEEMLEWLRVFEPRLAILEQVLGFDMPESKGAGPETTPKMRCWSSRKILYCCCDVVAHEYCYNYSTVPYRPTSKRLPGTKSGSFSKSPKNQFISFDSNS